MGDTAIGYRFSVCDVLLCLEELPLDLQVGIPASAGEGSCALESSGKCALRLGGPRAAGPLGYGPCPQVMVSVFRWCMNMPRPETLLSGLTPFCESCPPPSETGGLPLRRGWGPWGPPGMDHEG